MTPSPTPANVPSPDPARVARWEFLVQNTASYWPRQKAEAAIRLADEERASLVELVREMGREAVAEAEAYRAVFARAEAAEAKMAKVEALADEWEAGRLLSLEWNVPVAETAAKELRAVLDDAPAEQRADEVAYIHGDAGLGALAAGVFFDLDEDADGEPTIWLTKGTGDPLPMPVLSPSSLHPDVRHLWPVVARRILDANRAAEGDDRG